jgi:hypothetical protein
MENTSDTLQSILFVLYGILAVLIYLAIFITGCLMYLGKRNRGLVASEDTRAFQAKVQELLKRADYSVLREITINRLASHPGDALAEYYLGMACLRSGELVEAKNHFTRAVSLDAQWKNLCSANLEEIAIELKRRKPELVE